jgi:thymidylate kinase
VDAQRRCIARSVLPEIYDDVELQRKLAAAYDRAGEAFPDVPFITLDGARPVGEIADEVWTRVERIRASGAPK